MITFNQITDFILGPCTRNIESSAKVIYLTFDDGPNTYCTPQVLDLLKKLNVKATFFVIGNNIALNSKVFHRIKSEGHAVGNHSPNHDTKTYVKGKKALKKWIELGEALIEEHLGESSIGFRPPVGIRTPELNQIMKEIRSKPIMWQHRFYDTTFEFNDASWKRKFHKIKSGDIILLHDTHKKTDVFLATLESFIQNLIRNDFQLKALSKH